MTQIKAKPAQEPDAGMFSDVASLTHCSVKWVVQKLSDMGIWTDIPELTSQCQDVAEGNMAHVCNSLISELSRHRIVRRVTFDFFESGY